MSRACQNLFVAAAIALAASSPVLAQSTTDAVATFYYDLDSAFDPASRDRFTGPARALLDAADAAEEPCLDFSFVVDGQDYDEAEIERTLRVEEVPDTDPLVVVARFKLFGEPRAIEWTIIDNDGDFLISDVAAADGSWRLSEMSCE
jgi:hypothetical protein